MGSNHLMRRAVVVAVALGALALAASGSARQSAGPKEISSPVISGVATVGSTLTGAPGTWSGIQPITYKFQWLRCKADAGEDSSTASCQNISGATTATYLVSNSDLGFRIRFRVAAGNKQGKSTSTSTATSVVTTAGGKPANSSAPTISGVPTVGSPLIANPGRWLGDEPITLSYKWLRCDNEGNACKATGKTSKTYKVVQQDVGKTLRVQVIARNSRGTGDAFSAASAVVPPTGNGGIIDLPNGQKSIDAKDVPKDQRLVVENFIFNPNPVGSREKPINISIQVTDTAHHLVRNATVFIRSTPTQTTSADKGLTAVDGWITYSLMPNQFFPLKNGGHVQFFIKAYRKGDPTLGGIYGSRLVQVGTKAP